MKTVKKIIFILVTLISATVTVIAQDEPDENQLKLGAIITRENGDYTIHEYWVGGRLERVTVDRKTGLSEVYQNENRENSLWNSDENELGGTQNVRQWRLGSW